MMADGIRDGNGRILKNTDPLFTELAENYPHGRYTSFCNEFEVRFNQAEQIRTQKLGSYTDALKQVLNKWVDVGKAVTRSKLELALRNAKTGGLTSIVEKHFQKYAEVDESREEARTSKSDATQANTHAGSATGQSIAMTGNTFNVTNNFAAQTTEDKKRSGDEFDGPIDRKKTNENTMSMTKRHRKILEKSAPDLLNDLDTDDVLPYLLGDGVITTEDVAKVNANAKSTRKEKVSALLDILPRRGDRAYDAFLNSLEKTKGSLHLYRSVKNFEKTYQEENVFEENMPSSSQGSGSTPTQRDVNLTINASGHGTVQNNTITGQINNVTLR